MSRDSKIQVKAFIGFLVLAVVVQSQHINSIDNKNSDVVKTGAEVNHTLLNKIEDITQHLEEIPSASKIPKVRKTTQTDNKVLEKKKKETGIAKNKTQSAKTENTSTTTLTTAANKPDHLVKQVAENVSINISANPSENKTQNEKPEILEANEPRVPTTIVAKTNVAIEKNKNFASEVFGTLVNNSNIMYNDSKKQGQKGDVNSTSSTTIATATNIKINNVTTTSAPSSTSSSSSTTTTTTTTTTSTTTTTTTAKPKKPLVLYGVEDFPGLDESHAESKNPPLSPSSKLPVPEPPNAEPSQEFSGNSFERGSDYIVPIVSMIFIIPLAMGIVITTYRRFRDCWSTRHYRRMDFLVDGMYND